MTLNRIMFWVLIALIVFTVLFYVNLVIGHGSGHTGTGFPH
jgi:hypothetical protein